MLLPELVSFILQWGEDNRINIIIFIIFEANIFTHLF